MTDAVTIALIGAVVTVITSSLNLIQGSKIRTKQDVIHGQINGMQEKLITAEKSASKEEGKAEQREEGISSASQIATATVEAIKSDIGIDITKTKK